MSSVSTPPATTLSTPSPTVADGASMQDYQIGSDSIPTTQKDMSSAASTRPIYLIVATAVSPPLGIGIRGSLPWSQIRADMAFFRKVTTGSPSSMQSGGSVSTRNAVLMGRKTWDSIPPRFRPLGGRLNVILSRADASGLQKLASTIADQSATPGGQSGVSTGSCRTTELLETEDGQLIKILDENNEEFVIVTNSLSVASSIDQHASSGSVVKTFCIGGAEIYGLLLRDPQTRKRLKILQTLVRKVDGTEFECDTFWPEELRQGYHGWQRVSGDQLKVWTEGVGLPQEDKEWFREDKAGVDIQVVGWAQG